MKNDATIVKQFSPSALSLLSATGAVTGAVGAATGVGAGTLPAKKESKKQETNVI